MTCDVDYTNIVNDINAGDEFTWPNTCNLPNICEISSIPEVGSQINNINFLMQRLAIAYQATCECNSYELDRVFPINKSDSRHWYVTESRNLIIAQQTIQSGQSAAAWEVLTQKY